MITNMQARKENGIKKIARFYGLELENIVAFGDDYSDIKMLQMCGIGVATQNAIDIVKQNADIVCGANEQDGVAKWISTNIL